MVKNRLDHKDKVNLQSHNKPHNKPLQHHLQVNGKTDKHHK